MVKTKEEWAKVFSEAKAGHILWDGNAPDPYNPEHAYTTAKEFVNFGISLGCFNKGSRLLDLGCGNGRFCICFSEMDMDYTGIDPMRDQIEFCKIAFNEYPRLKFIHCDVYNECFNPKGTVPPEEYRLPFPDGYLDDVIAYSVFTHLQTLAVAQHYISEIKRVLKKGGNFFCTWYRSPPDPIPNSFIGRTVYNEWDIMTMLNGFTTSMTYGGHSGQYYDQWGMFCKKA